jgi:hypothetical protein
MSKLVLLMFSLLSQLVFSAPAPAPVSPEGKAHVQKEHSFDDLLVQGQFHFSEEAVSTVEADKVLDALIGVRKDFKERIELSDKGY